MTAILVTCSTGTLGRALVARPAPAGHTVRSLSRRPPPLSVSPGAWAAGDLRRDTGLAAALDAMDVVVHSIVGIDRVPLGYYQAKLATERLIEESALPWTILRDAVPRAHPAAVRGPGARRSCWFPPASASSRSWPPRWPIT